MIQHSNQPAIAMIFFQNITKNFGTALITLAISTTVYAQTYSGDKSEEITAKKCQLAKKIIAGKAVHADGSPTDAYDIEVAKSDIKIFCKENK
jgi:hypothetical protein